MKLISQFSVMIALIFLGGMANAATPDMPQTVLSHESTRVILESSV